MLLEVRVLWILGCFHLQGIVNNISRENTAYIAHLKFLCLAIRKGDVAKHTVPDRANAFSLDKRTYYFSPYIEPMSYFFFKQNTHIVFP